MKKLSSREFLLILALAAIVAIGSMARFIILPQAEKISQNKSTLAEQEARIESVQTELELYADIDKKLEDAKEEVNSISYLQKNTDDVLTDELIQSLAAAAGIQIEESVIYDAVVTNTDVFSVEAPFLSYPLREEAVIFDENEMEKYSLESAHAPVVEEGPQEETITETSIPVIRSVYHVTGNTDNVMAFVNSVNGLDKSVIVSNMESSIVENVFDGYISIDLYFIH